MAQGMPVCDWTLPFARTIDAAKKYVVSSTLDRVDWNAELVRGDLGKAVQQLKRESGKGLFVGGVKLPLALAELGLIDEYEFVVHPRLAGHGPTLFAGLPAHLDLTLVGRLELGSGQPDVRLKLENLQPIGSFKIRGAANAMSRMPQEQLGRGVLTASAGNMAQGLASVLSAAGHEVILGSRDPAKAKGTVKPVKPR